MTVNLVIVALALVGLLFLISAIRSFHRRRALGGLLRGTVALSLFLAAACASLIAVGLLTYQRLGTEKPAGELLFTRTDDHRFDGVFTFPNGERETFALRGDEWQVDARILKWHAFANLLGFDAAYRLDRISGRYTRLEDEQTQPRTVFSLNPTGRADLWELVQTYRSWVPWVDALYGSATFLPMADGALYEVSVSTSGLVGRPLNQAARAAVGGWHSP